MLDLLFQHQVAEGLRDLRETMVVRDMAIVELLVAKGIITVEEFSDALTRQRAVVDQRVAALRDKPAEE